MQSQCVIINPPVEDISCSGYFSLPCGALSFLNQIKPHIASFAFYDFLHEDFACTGETFTSKRAGLIEYPSTRINLPSTLKGIKRRYRRFGNTLTSFSFWLESRDIQLNQAKIFIQTDFTYRAQGVINFVRQLIEQWGAASENIILGGVCAALIPEYFKIRLPGIKFYSSSILKDYFNQAQSPHPPHPNLSVYKHLSYIPFRLSPNCPDHCDYCASAYLRQYHDTVYNSFSNRNSVPPPVSPSSLSAYLNTYSNQFDTNIIYPIDDALLVHWKLLPGFLEPGRYRVYTPNGIHLKYINAQSARVLYQCGFKELRFGVEGMSSACMAQSSFKIKGINIEEKITHLTTAGFRLKDIHFYLLYGLENQTFEDARTTINTLKKYGCKLNLCGYSPVPHTPMFSRLDSKLKGTLSHNPIITNNNTVSLWNPEFTEDRINELKTLSAV
jgi:hypothetical protein